VIDAVLLNAQQKRNHTGNSSVVTKRLSHLFALCIASRSLKQRQFFAMYNCSKNFAQLSVALQNHISLPSITAVKSLLIAGHLQTFQKSRGSCVHAFFKSH